MPSTSDLKYDEYVSRAPAPAKTLLEIFGADGIKTAFDIGACEGEESLRYARIFPQAQIYTFEPLPDNQSTIERQFSRYNADRCHLVKLAMADKSGVAKFHVSSGTPENKFNGDDWNYGNKSSSLLPPASSKPMHGWLEFNQTIDVGTERLDEFCGKSGIKQVDFMHIDVQGAEYQVLKGAGELLANTTAVWIEVATEEVYQGQKLKRDIEIYLEGFGFSLLFEKNNGIEGDQFYLNTRKPSAKFYYFRHKTFNLLRRIKRRIFR